MPENDIDKQTKEIMDRMNKDFRERMEKYDDAVTQDELDLILEEEVTEN